MDHVIETKGAKQGVTGGVESLRKDKTMHQAEGRSISTGAASGESRPVARIVSRLTSHTGSPTGTLAGMRPAVQATHRPGLPAGSRSCLHSATVASGRPGSPAEPVPGSRASHSSGLPDAFPPEPSGSAHPNQPVSEPGPVNECAPQSFPAHFVPDSDWRTATLGMGCFWSPEALFGHLPGVVRTRTGYAGGTTPEPDYRRMGDHTEMVQIDYDPGRISYEELLQVFWDHHNPVNINGYKGRQYLSLVLFHGEEQERAIHQVIRHRQDRGPSGKPETEIAPFSVFLSCRREASEILSQKISGCAR